MAGVGFPIHQQPYIRVVEVLIPHDLELLSHQGQDIVEILRVVTLGAPREQVLGGGDQLLRRLDLEHPLWALVGQRVAGPEANDPFVLGVELTLVDLNDLLLFPSLPLQPFDHVVLKDHLVPHYLQSFLEQLVVLSQLQPILPFQVFLAGS